MLHWSNTMQLIEEPKYTAPKEGKGGGGYSTKFYTGRVRHEVQSFTSFYIPFLTEKVPPTRK